MTSPTGSDAPSSGNEGMTAEDAAWVLEMRDHFAERNDQQAEIAKRILATYAAVERLKRENARLTREWDVAHRANEELCAEVARLESALADANRYAETCKVTLAQKTREWAKDDDALRARLAQAEQSNARVRTAIDKMADYLRDQSPELRAAIDAARAPEGTEGKT